ncbi:MAG TPA: endonuclease/exonuclease/phosphatase family protein [Longimicrobiales bacterium]|nr:endonuclease/exonuclease/phosphatase family protein [Longimicrobiales bacterium]
MRFTIPSALAAGALLLMHGCAASAPSGAAAEGAAARVVASSILPAPGAVRFEPEAGRVPLGHPVPTDSLVVATWNVHVGGGDIRAFVADLRRGALTGGIEPDAFVVLLQEVHRVARDAEELPTLRARAGEESQPLHFAPPSGERTDVVEVARELGLHLAYAPALPNGRPHRDAPLEDRGVAILSSHALDAVRVVELPRERQRRVALVGTVQGTTSDGSPWSLQVVSAHLENRTGWDRLLDSFGAARERQARFLARQLGPDPTVLGGDLNTWAPAFMEAALPVLEAHFPHTPRVEGATFKVAGIPRRLDHLLFRLPEPGSARAQVVAERYGSDHHPVMGVVGLRSSR